MYFNARVNYPVLIGLNLLPRLNSPSLTEADAKVRRGIYFSALVSPQRGAAFR